MVKSCVACTQRYEKGITFHRFPSDLEILKKWILSIRRENWFPKKDDRVCGAHFTEECYEKGWSDRKQLKKDAVPTIFKFTEHLPKKSPRSQRLPKKRLSTEKDNVNIARISRCNPKSNASSEAHVDVPVSVKAESAASSEAHVDVHNSESAARVEVHVAGKSELAASSEVHVKVSIPGNLESEASSEVHVNVPVPGKAESAASSEAHVKVPVKRKRKSCPGNIDIQKIYTFDEAISALNIVQQTLISKKQKIKILQQKIRRLEKKVTVTDSLIKNLEERSTSDNGFNNLMASIPESTRKCIFELLKEKRSRTYPPELRSFALTLDCCSPRAYQFVREIFPNLPNKRTMQKWYQKIDREPGLDEEHSTN